MSNSVLRRNSVTVALAFATAGILVSALSVHPQPAPGGATAPSQSSPGAGAASTPGTTSGSAGSAASPAAGAASKSAMVSKADRQMMRDIAHANLAEVETAKMAQSKSQNKDVKDFSQRMIDDHTKAQDELMQVAKTKGVELPTEPDAKHKAAMKKMDSLSGDAFDRQYIQQAGMKDHQETRSLLQRTSKNAKDSDLKAYAGKTLPVVEEHLKMAEKIKAGKQGGSASRS